MQTKQELEAWYAKKDPWGYKNNPDDTARKKRLLSLLKKRYDRALDIGCGEGWITQSLPADAIFGLETSDSAAERFPSNVTRIDAPEGKYDLVVATGVLYSQYNWRQMLDWIKNHASGTILLSNIKDWERPEVAELNEIANMRFSDEYPYRQYTQKLRLYDVFTS